MSKPEKSLFKKNRDGTISARSLAYFQTMQGPEGAPVVILVCIAESDPATGERIPDTHRQFFLSPQQAIEIGKALQSSGHKGMLRLLGPDYQEN